MATIAILAGGVLMAFGIAYVGVQGLRGIPDSNGKMTPKGTAIAALVIAVLILIGTFSVPFFLAVE